MSTTIRISTEVEAYIAKYGKFGETHNDVLCRQLIDFTPQNDTKKKVKKKSSITLARQAIKDGKAYSQKFFHKPLLKVLMSAEGHKLSAKNAINSVGNIVDLKPMDLEVHKKSRNIRWKNNVQWARKELVDKELMYPSKVSGVGIWILTPKGVAIAKKYLF